MANINDVYRKVNDIDTKLDKILSAIQNGMGSNSGNGGSGNNGNNNSKDNKKERDRKKQDITDSVVSMIESITNMVYKQLSISLKKQQINIEAASKIFQKQVEAFNKSTSIAIETITDLDGKNMVANSIKRLGTMMDASTELFRNQIEQNLILFNREQDIKIQNIESEQALVEGIGGLVSGALKAVGGFGIIAGGIADVTKSIWSSELDYKAKVAELAKIEKEQIVERATSGVQAINDYAKNFIPTWEKNITDIIKIEDESYALGRIFGYTRSNLSDFSDGIFKTNATMSELGKNWEDFLKIQRSYMDTTGRSIQLTGVEGLNISALAQWVGVSEEESARLVGNMQIFNKGAVESSESIFKMSQTAQSMGLSNQKFVKDLEKNLRLAQKYDFKNGTKGLMDMALFAQRTRMDMSQLDSILAGFHTGNIEDVITKAAQLNVLGGNAALISDPIGMLYDAYANPKGMGERVLQSISGMGFFNRSTGETEFGIAERMRIEQIAKAMGMSPENLTEMARQENKGRELNRLYGEKAFGKYSERVKQQAYYENGEWKVNVMGEGGETQAMSLSAIQGNTSLLEKIMPDTEQGQLLEVTKASLSTQQQIEQATEQIQSAVLEQSNKYVREKYGNEFVEAILRQGNFIQDFVRGTKEAADHAVKIKDIFTKEFKIDWNAIESSFRQIELTQEGMLNISKNEIVQQFIQAILNAANYDEMIQMVDKIATKQQNRETYEFKNKEWTEREAELKKEWKETPPLSALQGWKGVQLWYHRKFKKPKEPVDDAIITPSGKIVKPNSQDFNVLMKQGGDIQRMLGGSQSNDSNTPRSINVSGSLFLNTNGQSVDLVELINRNPEEFYRVTSNILFPTNGQSRVNV